MKTVIGKVLIVLSTISFLLYYDLPVYEEEEEITGTINGTIIDAKNTEPISGVNVILEPKGGVSYTDSIGKYEFNEMSPGYYTLYISKPGYKTSQKRIKIIQGETINAKLALKPSNS